jgi:hypothetical protein
MRQCGKLSHRGYDNLQNMIQKLPHLPALIPWIGGDLVVLEGELQEAIRKPGNPGQDHQN